MKYTNFQYIYPPRPEVKVRHKDLPKWETGDWYLEPKMEGSCCLVFTDGTQCHIYNRHKTLLSGMSSDTKAAIMKISKGWTVFIGELMNKGKTGPAQKGFVIFDVLVWDGEYLVGRSLRERLEILDKLGNRTEWVNPIGPDLYVIGGTTKNFEWAWTDLMAKGLTFEGVVLKRLNARLEPGIGQKNNIGWQIKSRREHKNFSY
jgi:ATP-dependent DNA ligase